MGNPEESADRQAGPVPQGDPPAEATPYGGPTSAGPSLTGHPLDSSAPHPSPEQEETAVAPSAPVDASAPPGGEGGGEKDDGAPQGRAAQRAVVKRLTKERDEFLDQCRRVQAEFEN